MKRFPLILAACLIGVPAVAMLPASVYAQAAPPIYSQQELDQLLAPVALYPDPLLSQVLMAATYPIETVQASRFVRQNPSLRGNALAQAVANQPWDPSVKSLTQFPAVLAMMDDQLAWTQKLGDAFLAQQGAVMDTVQALRARAQATGSLRSNQQQRVVVQDGDIDIEPYAPDIIYVPYYNPTVVYGNWWWPDRRPMVWQPPVVYQSPSYGSAIATGIAFGLGIGIVASIFDDARPDWRRHNFVTYRGPGGNRLPGGGAVWAHNPEHRHGVAYRDAQTRERFQPQAGNNGGRDAYRGRVPAGPPRPPGAAGVPGAPQGQNPVNTGNGRNAPNTTPQQGMPARGQGANLGQRQLQAPPGAAPAAPGAVGQQRMPHGDRPQRPDNEQQRALTQRSPQNIQQAVQQPPQRVEQRSPQNTQQNIQQNAPRNFQRPAMERSHPLIPSGPANVAQSNADRGRASREARGFTPAMRAAPPPRPAQPPQAPRAPQAPQMQPRPQPPQHGGPAAPQGQHPRSH